MKKLPIYFVFVFFINNTLNASSFSDSTGNSISSDRPNDCSGSMLTTSSCSSLSSAHSPASEIFNSHTSLMIGIDDKPFNPFEKTQEHLEKEAESKSG